MAMHDSVGEQLLDNKRNTQCVGPRNAMGGTSRLDEFDRRAKIRKTGLECPLFMRNQVAAFTGQTQALTPPALPKTRFWYSKAGKIVLTFPSHSKLAWFRHRGKPE